MKQIWKSFLKRVLPIALSFAFIIAFSGSALAESGKPDRETGKPSWAGEKSEKETKERNENQERVKKTYRGISTDKIALAIESVTDEATKAELTAMLDAYIAALSDKDAALAEGGMSMSELSQLASSARSSLKDALEAAGFTLGSVLGWQEWKDYGNEALDLESIALLIDALDDTDLNKEALASLLAAYEAAQAAKDTATEEDEDALDEAAKAAREALLEALYTAGLFPLATPEEVFVPTEPVI